MLTESHYLTAYCRAVASGFPALARAIAVMYFRDYPPASTVAADRPQG